MWTIQRRTGGDVMWSEETKREMFAKNSPCLEEEDWNPTVGVGRPGFRAGPLVRVRKE